MYINTKVALNFQGTDNRVRELLRCDIRGLDSLETETLAARLEFEARHSDH